MLLILLVACSIGKIEDIEPILYINDEIIIDKVIESNLDKDEKKEQIVIYKDKEDTSVKIYIVDYDEFYNKYKITWHNNLLASKFNNLDFIYKKNDNTFNNLIFKGLDKNDNKTIDIFRNKTLENGFIFSDLQYYSILKEKYKSFAEIQKDLTVNLYDFLKRDNKQLYFLNRTYKWNIFSKQYNLIKTEEVIENKDFLNKNLDKETFFKVKNAWIKEDKDLIYLLNINLKYLTFAIYSKNDNLNNYKKLFNIKDFSKSIENNDIIFLELYDNPYDDLKIKLLSSRDIEIEYNEFSGIYKKLKDDIFKNNKLLNNIDNIYEDNKKNTYIFLNNNFTLIDKDGKTKKGNYITYKLNEDVLDIVILNDDEATISHNKFIFKTEKEEQDNFIANRLLLKPAFINILGIESKNEDEIILENIEFKND